MTRKAILSGFVLAAFLLAAVPVGKAPENDSITEAPLKADLHFLASDAMRGRLTESPEYELAADWIESRFRRAGLEGAGPEGVFAHTFTLISSGLGQNNRMQVEAGGVGRGSAGKGVRELKPLEDFMPLFFSPSARAEGDVIFAGYGINAPGLKWHDLASEDLRGKIVLILEGEPEPNDPQSRFDGVVSTIHSDPLRKALAAQKAGALALLMVSSDPSAADSRFPQRAKSYWPSEPPRIRQYALASMAEGLHIPVAAISPVIAGRLMDRPVADLVKAAAKPGAPAPGAKLTVTLETDVNRRFYQDRSIVAQVQGSDPTLADETVIIGAHYDHNGASPEQIYNGADDNGSGTVALLAIADAYARAAANGQRPKRTVLFAAWGSEERCCGPLLGAWAWTQNPWRPLEKTVAVLNMDMIGRNEEIPKEGGSRFRGLPAQTAASNADAVNVIGTSYSPDLKALVSETAADFGITPRFRYDNNPSNLLRRSDQYPFLQVGVPAVWFHTGLHPDYHTQFDRPERIEYPKMLRITKLVHQLSWNLAQSESRPKMLNPRPIPPPD